MKTILHLKKPRELMTIQEFAEKHLLTMEIFERENPSSPSMRFFARFKKAELRIGENFLSGVSGDGSTPEKAVARYSGEISGGLLIVDAYGPNRQEIEVPTLTFDVDWRAE